MMSRAARCIWMLEEVGVAYEHIPINQYDPAEAKSADYLAIHPAGKVPALVDGDLVMFESLAINLYLARKYGPALWPRDMAGEGLAFQWSFWAMTEAEPHMFTLVFERMIKPEAERDESAALAAIEKLQGPLGLLDGALEGRDYLLGGNFSVADLNAAVVLSFRKMGGVDLSAFGNVGRWLDACLSRPAFQKMMALRG